MERVAVYGGAFNPPTIGHKTVLQRLLTSGQVSRLIFSPDGQRKDKNYGVTSDERIRLIKAFYEALKSDGFDVEFEEYFLENNISTSTIGVDNFYIEKLGLKPWHVFGIDTMFTMPTWVGNTNRYIEDKLRKIFILRRGYEVPENIQMSNYIVLDLDILEISSTTVREMIRNKMSVDRVLTPEVKGIIEKESLYI